MKSNPNVRMYVLMPPYSASTRDASAFIADVRRYPLQPGPSMAFLTQVTSGFQPACGFHGWIDVVEGELDDVRVSVGQIVEHDEIPGVHVATRSAFCRFDLTQPVHAIDGGGHDAGDGRFDDSCPPRFPKLMMKLPRSFASFVVLVMVRSGGAAATL